MFKHLENKLSKPRRQNLEAASTKCRSLVDKMLKPYQQKPEAASRDAGAVAGLGLSTKVSGAASSILEVLLQE